MRQKMRNNEYGQGSNRNYEKKNEITNVSKQLDERETVAGFRRRCNVLFYLQGSISCGHFTE